MEYVPDPDLAKAAEKLRVKLSAAVQKLIRTLDELGVDPDDLNIHPPSQHVQKGQEVKAFGELNAFAELMTNRYGVLAPEGIAVMNCLMEVYPAWQTFKNTDGYDEYYGCEQA
jgi:hypothetical protein